MNSFKINYGAWKTSVNEQQAVLVGNPFKPIPIEPLRLDLYVGAEVGCTYPKTQFNLASFNGFSGSFFN